MEKSHKYAAFISYAHADERVAKKLHERLETYPLPKGIDKAERAKLFPVFRDVTELTAHHSLSEKIRDAVRTSRFLIVLCSPAAKQSHWVNEEIKLFRKLHGEGSILAVIVEGVPDTAFPPALTADGREPLAANMATNEGFRFGVTQLAASMLGVGLDRLVQRDQRRRRIRTQLVTGVTTALAIIMGGLAWTAIDARDEAEEALEEALTARNASEEMVEFLIKDFKEELVPLQKLHLFESVGKKVRDYYKAIPPEDMDDDRLMRKAETWHVLGSVELERANYDKTGELLREAFMISEDVYIRNPEKAEAIYAHAQSEYWMGENLARQYEYESTLKFWKNYYELTQKLAAKNLERKEWLMEASWGAANYALINSRVKKPDFAQELYNESIDYLIELINLEPHNHKAKIELANIYMGASNVIDGNTDKAELSALKEKSVKILEGLVELDEGNLDWKFRYIEAKFRLLSSTKELSCPMNKYDDNFQNLLEESQKLTDYEPDNFYWKREFLIQWSRKLYSCANNPSFDSATLSEFLRQTSTHRTDKTLSDYYEMISKLRDRKRN